MKITQFDPDYSRSLGTGDTFLVSGPSGGSNSGFGGDVVGDWGNLSVIGLRSTVALSSNLTGSVGDVLTIISTSPRTAQFSSPSNTAVSSNAVTRTLGGQETIVTHAAAGSARQLDVGGGNVFDVTLNSATCTLSFAGVPTGVSCAITVLLRQDGTGGRLVTWPASVVWPGAVTPTLATAASAVDVFSLFTIDNGTTWYGFPTTTSSAAVSAGSNSTRVREVSTAGASTTLWSPFDHAHDGIGTIISNSSNTMQRGTFNLKTGNGISFGLTDTDGDGELDTMQIHSSGGGGGGGAGTAMASAAYKRTAGDYTTSSTSLGDIDNTNMNFTITTGAHRVLVGFFGSVQSSVANDQVGFEVLVDGTAVGGSTDGLLIQMLPATANRRVICAFTHLTDQLTAASHTFKIQWKRAGGSGTLTLFGGTSNGNPSQFWVAEQNTP